MPTNDLDEPQDHELNSATDALNVPEIGRTWWIFQANPEKYAVDQALLQLDIMVWQVNRYADRISPGDGVYVWRSGKAAGIIAEATVIDFPHDLEESIAEKKFYVDQNEIPNVRFGVTLHIDRVLESPGIPRTSMTSHDVLKDMLILRMANSTNFALSTGESAELAKLMGEASVHRGSSRRDLLAFRAWSILTRTAEARDLITYGRLAAAIDVYQLALRFTLGIIQKHCEDEKLPPLSVLAVNQETQRPGGGFTAWDVDDFKTAVEMVYAENWSRLDNPFAFAADGTSEDDLIEDLFNNPASSADVYRLIKLRGKAQRAFRKLLLRVYRSRCAFCGLTYSQALEAAHIVPWSLASIGERMDSTNGLLLCSTHHRLFDSGILRLTPEYKIECTQELKPKHSESDRVTAHNLHGSKIFIPQAEKHCPSPERISRRNELYEEIDTRSKR